MMLGDFNAKIGGEDIFTPTIGNESLHEISNDNGVRIVNFPTSKNLTAKSKMFPHRNIHKFTWTSPDALCYKMEGRRFKSWIRWIFSILPTALWPWGRLSL
jgi:hypothetical protein